MADVIRDVVVRVTLEQINTALKVPDLAPIKQEYQDVGKIATEVADQKIKKMSEAEAAARKESRLQREYIKDVSDTAKQSAKEYEAQLKQREDAEKRAAESAEAAASKQLNAKLKVLEVSKQLIEGTFQLARGFAFLAASSDEDFHELLATIAKLQGGFDLIKGGATTIKGLVDGVTALKIATGSATTGQALLATANTAVATTAGTATAAITALKVSLGPIGLILTGISVASLAVGAGWASMSSSGDDLTETNNRLTASMERSLKVYQQQLDLAGKFRDIRKEEADANIDLLSGEEKLRAIRSRMGANENLNIVDGALLNLEQQQARAMREAENNKGDNRTAFREYGLEQEKLALDLANRRAENAKNDVDYQRQIRDIKLQSVQAAESQLEKEKQIVETAKKGVETAMQKLAAEEKKLQSIEAQFGALTKQEQLELKSLADKARAGEELTRRELERAAQLGGDISREFVQQQQARAGREAGVSDVAAGFGIDVTAGITEAGRNLQDAITRQVQAEARAVEAEAELGKATAAYEQTVALLKSLIDQAGELQRQVAEFQNTVDRNNALNQ